MITDVWDFLAVLLTGLVFCGIWVWAMDKSGRGDE